MKCFLFGVVAIAALSAACSGAQMDGLALEDSQSPAPAADSGASGASSHGTSDSGSSSVGTTAEDSGTIDTDASVASEPDAGSTSGSGVFSGDGAFTSKTGPNGHHNVGQDCLSCHDGSSGAPEFSFAGTLYDASGNAVGGAEVRVVDAMGNAVSVTTGSDGNFYQFGSSAFAGPGHAGIRNATTTDLMVSAVTKGGCNACHCSGGGCTTARLHLP
jgi:hypothetical protein